VPTPREQLANILRQSRLDAGYESHGALAKRLNVSRPVVTRAENAATRRRPMRCWRRGPVPRARGWTR